MRHCVWSRNFVNEEDLAHWGVVATKTNKQTNKQTNKLLFSVKTLLKTPNYANFYALLLICTFTYSYFPPHPVLRNALRTKEKDRDSSEQIYYVNKKRHTLVTLGRSSEIKKKTSDRTLWQIAVLYFCSLRGSSSLSINWWKQADRTSNCLGQTNSLFQEFDMLSSNSHRIATKQWTKCCTWWSFGVRAQYPFRKIALWQQWVKIYYCTLKNSYLLSNL